MARVTSGYAYVVAVVGHVVVKKARKLFWQGVWMSRAKRIVDATE